MISSSGNQDLDYKLDGFLLAALRKKNDTDFLLKLDTDLEVFLLDQAKQRLDFPPMNSYHRLIVHRVAQYFQMAHVVSADKQAVTLFKGPQTRLPPLRFADLLDCDYNTIAQKLLQRQQFEAMQSMYGTYQYYDTNQNMPAQESSTLHEFVPSSYVTQQLETSPRVHDYEALRSYEGVKFEKDDTIQITHILQVVAMDPEEFRKLAMMARIVQLNPETTLAVFTSTTRANNYLQGKESQVALWKPTIDSSMSIPPVKHKRK